jgi:hypothetical protein
VMYSIASRAYYITTRPLYNVLQPMHPLTRYQWVQLPTYVSPPGSQNFGLQRQTTVNAAKMPVRAKIRATQRVL